MKEIGKFLYVVSIVAGLGAAFGIALTGENWGLLALTLATTIYIVGCPPEWW